MKRFTKSGMANVLQVTAILVMFGYPGCSSDKGSKEPSSPANAWATDDTTIQIKPVNFKSLEGSDKRVVVKQ